MPKLMEKFDLLRDLAAVNDMLASAHRSDPIGRLTFESRKQMLEQRLAELESEPERAVSVALLFQGDPVFGSRAIDADFATDAIRTFQEIVSKQFAEKTDGGLSESGRGIPFKELSALRIRSVAHGSFGFILEERDPDQSEMFPTRLRETMDEVTDIIASFYSDREEDYLGSVDSINARVFNSVREFFGLLNKSNAALRLVEGERDEWIDRERVTRAFERSSATQVEETEDTLEGILVGVAPHEMRFEFKPDGQPDPVIGRSGPRISRNYLERIEREGLMLGSRFRAKIITKTTKRPSGQVIRKHTFADLQEIR